MVKILHTADVHLDAPLRSLAMRDEGLRSEVAAATRAAFARIVDVALSERVTALLISGDLFDGKARSARTAAFLTAQFDRLRESGILVCYIKGNHDAENPITGALELPDNVHVFDARGGKLPLSDDVWVHGVSFADRTAPESLLPRFPAPVPGAVNIAMLHTSLAGASGHDTYAPCTLSELIGMGFDYWALGHVHKRSVHAQEPWVVMPGMPQGRDIGEAGAKTASLLTVTNGRIAVQEVPTSVVEFVRTALDITGLDSNDRVRGAVRSRIRDIAAGLSADAGVLRLTLTGTSARHWQILRDQDIWAETVADEARTTGRLWLEKLRVELDTDSGMDRSASATAELATLMEEIRSEPGFAAAVRTEIEEMIGDLPPTLRATLLPEEASAATLGHTLAKVGAQRVLARMKGAED